MYLYRIAQVSGAMAYRARASVDRGRKERRVCCVASAPVRYTFREVPDTSRRVHLFVPTLSQIAENVTLC